jgi:hypothetical protein
MVRGQTGSIALVQVFREKFAVEHRSGVAIKGQIWLEGDRLVATRERLFEALRCPTSFDIADVPSLHQRYHNARAELRNFASIEVGGLIVPTPAPMSPGVKSGQLDRIGSASVAVRRSLGNGARPLQLPRRADQQPRDPGVPRPHRRTTRARASLQEGPDDLGAGPPTGSPNPTAFIPGQRARFAVTHPRWEPYPRIGHVLCGGRSVMSVPAMTHLHNKNSLVSRPGCSMLTTAVCC